jgi:D-3-phosphoglycerate dehydrogenase
VGLLVGRLARAFGARVLGFDPFADGGRLATQGIRPVGLEALLAEADVISLHARVGKGQPPLLGPAQFAAMQRRPYVLNTARAAALDYGALVDALAAGRIAGAYLDVYPEEPIPPVSPLLALDRTRLHLTPHAAGVSRDVPRTTARLLAGGVAALLEGRRPDHVVNPEALEAALQRVRTLRG